MDWLRKNAKYLIGITGLSALSYQPETSRTRSDIWSSPHVRKRFGTLCLDAYIIRRGPLLWPLGTKNMCEFTHLCWAIFVLEEKFNMVVRVKTFMRFPVVLLFLMKFLSCSYPRCTKTFLLEVCTLTYTEALSLLV
jgi:hypothetical protein